VLGDSFGAAIVEHYSKKELDISVESPQRVNGNMVVPIGDLSENGYKVGHNNSTFLDERM
jgi:hypothetical protein